MVELDNLVVTGNATDEHSETGWFIGHFISPAYGLRCTRDVEVKWGEHRSNDKKAMLAANETATTLTLLVRGLFVVEFPSLDISVRLEQPGDYVIFAPKVAHGWTALEDSVILTIRWPSVAGDQKQIR
jgi:hypothetical protein